MKKVFQAFSVCAYNYHRWRRNPRIIVTFLLAFILCFLLTDKVGGSATEKRRDFSEFLVIFH